MNFKIEVRITKTESNEQDKPVPVLWSQNIELPDLAAAARLLVELESYLAQSKHGQAPRGDK